MQMHAAGIRLIQVNADNVVGLEFVRDRAITHAGHHGGQGFALLHEIFGADRVKEALTESNFAEGGTATGRLSSHVNQHQFGREQVGSLTARCASPPWGRNEIHNPRFAEQ